MSSRLHIHTDVIRQPDKRLGSTNIYNCIESKRAGPLRLALFS